MAEQRSAGRPALQRALLLAAAISIAAELMLYRVALPVLSHIPDSDLGAVGPGLESIAQRTFSASPVLVIGSAAVLMVDARRSRPALSLALVAALASVAAATLLSGDLAAFGARAALFGAVAVVAAHAWTALPRDRAVAHSAAAGAVLAGQWPLLLEDASAATGVGASSGVVLAASAGELALVLTAVLFALACLRDRSPSRAAWVVSAGAGLLVAALLARSPDYAAIVSTWAVGATLSLPPFIYIVAASCASLAIVEWLRDPDERLLAAGLVLLGAAALQPAVVHHNLTAVLALALLVLPWRRAASTGLSSGKTSPVARDRGLSPARQASALVGAHAGEGAAARFGGL